MNLLVGFGAGAFGAVVGGIIFYFVVRIRKLSFDALKVVVTLLAGSAGTYFINAYSMTDEYKILVLSCYPIGLFLGWGMPMLLKWAEDQNRREQAGRTRA